MLPLLTGVVLMLGLGILAQRSETVMEWLGEPAEVETGPLVLLEDSARVIRGKPTVIDVLANDVGLKPQDINNIVIASPPQCGIANVAGGGIEYVATPSCGAQQAFSYRIDGRAKEAFGLVRISVIDADNAPEAETTAPELVAAAPQQVTPEDLFETEQPTAAARLSPVAPAPETSQPQVAIQQPSAALEVPNATPSVPQASPQQVQTQALAPVSPPAIGELSQVPQPQGGLAEPTAQAPQELALHQPAPELELGTIEQPTPAPKLLSDEQPVQVPSPGEISAPSLLGSAPSLETGSGSQDVARAEPGDSSFALTERVETDTPTAPVIRQPELTVAMAIPDAPVDQPGTGDTAVTAPAQAAPLDVQVPASPSIASLGSIEPIDTKQPLPHDTVRADRLTPALQIPEDSADRSFDSALVALAPTDGSRFVTLDGAQSAIVPNEAPLPQLLLRDRVRVIAPSTAAPDAPDPIGQEALDDGVAVASLSAPDASSFGGAPDPLLQGALGQDRPTLPPQPEPAPAVETAALTPSPENIYEEPEEQSVATPQGDPAESSGGFLGGLSSLFGGRENRPQPQPQPSPSSDPEQPAPPAAVETQEEDNVEVAALPQASAACVTQPALGISMQPAAQTLITVEAPCSAGRPAQLSYDGMSFAVPLDANGVGEVMALGLQDRANATMTFFDGETIEFDLQFSGMNRVMRAALVWDMPVKLDLHAIEFGGRPNTDEDTNPGNPRSYGEIRRRGGGFMTSFQPISGTGQHVQIYTHFMRRSGRAGVVDLMIDFVSRDRDNDAQACGAGSLAKPSFKLLKSDRGSVGRPVVASLGSVACESVDTSGAALAKNLIDTIVISP
ncbi:MAG: hypothetical protein AAGC81_14170 [Pseudomonadota bacterium]